MSDWVLISQTGSMGTYMRQNAAGDYEFKKVGDVASALDLNKAMLTHNDGYSPTRELRRAATIPVEVQALWLSQGFDMFDPNNAEELKRRLNSSDWAHLRTAPGTL